MDNAIEKNGVCIARTPTGVGVSWPGFFPPAANQMLKIELWYAGKLLTAEYVQTYGPPYREYLGKQIGHLKLAVRVKGAAGNILAELATDADEILPFMVAQGEQTHITENYVSVPPALHITDAVGAVWTLGMISAPKDQSPEGEFGFAVLRDGVDVHEIASRIEIRTGKIRVFTRNGWKVFNGTTFF